MKFVVLKSTVALIALVTGSAGFIGGAIGRLLGGEPFARLAAEVSDSGSKANGGLVGPLAKTDSALVLGFGLWRGLAFFGLIFGWIFYRQLALVSRTSPFGLIDRALSGEDAETIRSEVKALTAVTTVGDVDLIDPSQVDVLVHGRHGWSGKMLQHLLTHALPAHLQPIHVGR